MNDNGLPRKTSLLQQEVTAAVVAAGGRRAYSSYSFHSHTVTDVLPTNPALPGQGTPGPGYSPAYWGLQTLQT